MRVYLLFVLPIMLFYLSTGCGSMSNLENRNANAGKGVSSESGIENRQAKGNEVDHSAEDEVDDPEAYKAPDTLPNAEQGVDYYRHKMYSKAIPILEKESAKDPKDAKLWGYLGESYLAMGKRSKALDAYDHYLKLNPDNLVLKEWLEEQKKSH